MKKLIRVTTVPISLDKLLGSQLTFMNRHLKVTAISAGPEELKRVGAKYGVGAFHVEMTRQITPFQDLKALWKLYRFLKKEKPEIVHTHTPKAGIVGMLAAWMAGVPHRLHTVAGMPLMETEGFKRIVLDGVEKLTYHFATRVYPNSKGLYDFILDGQYTTASKLTVIANGSSNGIDTTAFAPDAVSESDKQLLRTQLSISEQDFVFVFVGRLVGHKGINELVSAFKKMTSPLLAGELGKKETAHQSSSGKPKDLSRIPRLLLIGPLETNLDPLTSETLTEIENNPNIIAVGFQPDVRPYLAISDALAFPSYREGFPNVVMQAGAMGLPAIVTDINGCNEIIIEGQNGTIIPPKNTTALQNAMQHMLTDDPWRTQLKQNARPMITSRYEQQLVWDALLEEYRTLLNPFAPLTPQ